MDVFFEQIIEINATIDLQRVLPDRYKTIPIIEFKVKERQYGERLIKEYIKKYQRLKEKNYDIIILQNEREIQ